MWVKPVHTRPENQLPGNGRVDHIPDLSQPQRLTDTVVHFLAHRHMVGSGLVPHPDIKIQRHLLAGDRDEHLISHVSQPTTPVGATHSVLADQPRLLMPSSHTSPSTLTSARSSWVPASHSTDTLDHTNLGAFHLLHRNPCSNQFFLVIRMSHAFRASSGFVTFSVRLMGNYGHDMNRICCAFLPRCVYLHHKQRAQNNEMCDQHRNSTSRRFLVMWRCLLTRFAHEVVAFRVPPEIRCARCLKKTMDCWHPCKPIARVHRSYRTSRSQRTCIEYREAG